MKRSVEPAPDVSVVIVTYRCGEHVLACLESLKRDPTLGIRPVGTERRATAELIVIDMDSGDGTAELVAENEPLARVVACRRNLGFAAGCNLGVGHASGRHILLLNPDTLVEPGVVARLTEYLDQNPAVGAVGPALVDMAGRARVTSQKFPTLATELARHGGPMATRLGFVDAGLVQPEAPGPVDWISGACLMIRRSTLADVGLLDSGFFLYYEETDWCLRARNAGWQVHCLPQVRVVHHEGKCTDRADAGVDRRRIHRVSRRRYFRRHHGWPTALAVECLHGMRAVARSARKVTS